jgi:hypothetical protein
MKIPLAFGTHKYFCCEMPVRRVDLARWHGHPTHLKAVLFAQTYRLVRILGNAGSDEGVIFLRCAFGNAVIDESLGGVPKARERYESFF